MVEYVIDSELLILAIEKRPLIWDSSHEHFKHRDKRREAWIEICRIFFDDIDTKEDAEKVFISKQLETKWRHIRDNFTREVRERMRGGADGTPSGRAKRKYIYAELLEFMRPGVEKKFRAGDGRRRYSDDGGSEDGAAVDDDSDEPVEPVSKKPHGKTHRSKRAARDRPALTLPFEETFLPTEQAPRETVSEESDDLAFFRSLAPMLAPLTAQQKMKFRIDVMQQLMKYHGEASGSSGGGKLDYDIHYN